MKNEKDPWMISYNHHDIGINSNEHMDLSSSRLVSSLCIGTTLFIVIFWIALTPVEADITDDINWYIFTNLHLLQMKNYHLIFKYFSYISLPLIILITVYKPQLQHSGHFKRLTKAIEFLILTVNCALLMFLFVKARKMLYLLKLYLLYLAVLLASSNIIITPQILMGFILLSLIYHLVTKYSVVWDSEQLSDNHWLKNCVRVVLFYLLLHLIRYCVLVSLCNISVNCSDLPAKPLLTAHRGCKDNYPENSIAAFEGTSSNIDSAATLETDVHISYDGVPFLLHDDTLARTTNIRSKCPNLSPLIPASLLNYNSLRSSCNLKQLKITVTPISPLQVRENVKETIPTLRDFLNIASNHNKSIIFDINEPQNPDHPYREEFIKLITDAIKTSKISEEKVWWLYREGRSHVIDIFPKMIQATKTKETPFEEFKQGNISLVNDEWTIPEHLIKKYHGAGILLNIWVINSRPLFEIFWCHGVKSITTNACDYINKINTNTYHEAYRELLNISDPIGLYVSVLLFVFLMFYLRKDSEQGSSLKLTNRYFAPITTITLIHIVFLYINATSQ